MIRRRRTTSARGSPSSFSAPGFQTRTTPSRSVPMIDCSVTASMTLVIVCARAASIRAATSSSPSRRSICARSASRSAVEAGDLAPAAGRPRRSRRPARLLDGGHAAHPGGQLAHAGDEAGDGEGLGQVAVGAGGQAAGDVVGGGAGRQQQHPDAGGGRVGAQRGADLQAGGAGHGDVEDREVGEGERGRRPGPRAVGRPRRRRCTRPGGPPGTPARGCRPRRRRRARGVPCCSTVVLPSVGGPLRRRRRPPVRVLQPRPGGPHPSR